MSLSFNGAGFVTTGQFTANAEVMEELNRARAPLQSDLQPAHLLRKQTTDSSLQDKVRFLAEANWGGECEPWVEELERQGGLPRENSLDMIDIAAGIPDFMDEQKLDPLILDPSTVHAWEPSTAVNGRTLLQQPCSVGGGDSRNDKGSMQEVMPDPKSALTLSRIEGQEKSTSVSAASPGSIHNVHSRAFPLELSVGLPSCEKPSTENMMPMQIVSPKPLTVCNPQLTSYATKDEFHCDNIGPAPLPKVHDHSPNQMEHHPSFYYGQYAPSFQDFHQQHHVGSAAPASMSRLSINNQAWGLGETAGFQCQASSTDMNMHFQGTVLAPENENAYGHMFGTPQTRTHGTDSHTVSQAFGTSGLSESGHIMYNNCSAEMNGACHTMTGQVPGMNMCHVDESIKQAVERCIKPMLGPDMQVGIVIIDNKSGASSPSQRVVATPAENHNQISCGTQPAIHAGQNNSTFYDGSYGASYPSSTHQYPQSGVSELSTNLDFGGLCNRLVDNTNPKPPIRGRFPSSKRMSSDLSQDLIQGPSFGQCHPDIVQSDQVIRGHTCSSESVGTYATQGSSRVPRTNGRSEEATESAHQCPTKVSRRNTLGEGDPRQQSSGEDNLVIGESGPSSGGADLRQGYPPHSPLENNQSGASNPPNRPSVEECLASLMRGMNSNQDVRQLLPLHAPGQVDAVLEAEMQTVDFDLRVARAERKIQEHNENMNRIDRMIASGQIDKEEGKALRRRVYNRREAAASRARDDKRLREIVLQKCRLENLERQLRELLVCGASANMSTNAVGHQSSRPSLRNVLSVNDIEGLNTHSCED